MESEKLYKDALSLEQEGQFKEALTVYKKLVKIKTDSRYLIAYGICLQKLGYWKQSIPMLEKGISLKPHYCEGDARLFLATSYIESGKKSKAIQQWRLDSKMKPEYPSYEHVPKEAQKMLKKYL